MKEAEEEEEDEERRLFSSQERFAFPPFCVLCRVIASRSSSPRASLVVVGVLARNGPYKFVIHGGTLWPACSRLILPIFNVRLQPERCADGFTSRDLSPSAPMRCRSCAFVSASSPTHVLLFSRLLAENTRLLLVAFGSNIESRNDYGVVSLR